MLFEVSLEVEFELFEVSLEVEFMLEFEVGFDIEFELIKLLELKLVTEGFLIEIGGFLIRLLKGEE